ncbi:MAG: AbrB/MazE/SpoVT family DNA-binding domain-containing protein [Gemmatimonadetes bacterium]|nr:AbrB/MazE/SpoVT family DNA-binding domain-containing protein [Gemmatimonadota bacterium]
MTTRSRAGAGDSPKRAKLFWNGRSQAVRLPKEFRFEGEEVAIRREGDRVILEPIRKRDWPVGYWDRIDALRGDLELGEVEPFPARLLDLEDLEI